MAAAAAAAATCIQHTTNDSHNKQQFYLFSLAYLAVQLWLHGIRLLTGTVYGSSSSNISTACYQ